VRKSGHNCSTRSSVKGTARQGISCARGGKNVNKIIGKR
jgi:hypothetical protein